MFFKCTFFKTYFFSNSFFTSIQIVDWLIALRTISDIWLKNFRHGLNFHHLYMKNKASIIMASNATLKRNHIKHYFKSIIVKYQLSAVMFIMTILSNGLATSQWCMQTFNSKWRRLLPYVYQSETTNINETKNLLSAWFVIETKLYYILNQL